PHMLSFSLVLLGSNTSSLALSPLQLSDCVSCLLVDIKSSSQADKHIAARQKAHGLLEALGTVGQNGRHCMLHCAWHRETKP
ncbi:hypothetical protein V8C86DRAFT_2544197, partial [Haematococcus lacustris]